MLKKYTSVITIIAMLITMFIIDLPQVHAEGKFKLSENSRFYIVSRKLPPQELLDIVELVDSQFAASGIPGPEPLDIVYGSTKNVVAGDIVIKMERMDNPQEYSIKTTEDNIWIVAGDALGALYGMDALLQEFILRGNSTDLDSREHPYAQERTVLLDCGRKFYSRQWIENLIKRMSWQRYTSLVLHFSDTEGMRFESKLYPWLNEPTGEYLTQTDLKSICETARRHGIEIIPELDSPGHMDYIIEKYAEYVRLNPEFTFQYGGITYSQANEGFDNISNYYMYHGAKSRYNNTGVDLANPVARAFTSSLIDEFAQFFANEGSTKFGIGGDEIFGWHGTTVGGRHFTYNQLWDAMEHWEHYAQNQLNIVNGSSADTFISYLNSTASRLANMGYSCRVWNDELNRSVDQHVTLDKSIDIIYWSNNYTPISQLELNGNRIHNTNTGWCYYVIRRDKAGGDIMDKTRKNCNSNNIYDNWEPRNCANPTDSECLISTELYAGGYFSIWADNPEYKDQVQVWDDTDDRTWANSAKLWNNKINELKSYDEFMNDVERLGAFPGYSGNCEEPSVLPSCGETVSELTKLEIIKGFLFH